MLDTFALFALHNDIIVEVDSVSCGFLNYSNPIPNIILTFCCFENPQVEIIYINLAFSHFYAIWKPQNSKKHPERRNTLLLRKSGEG